MLALAMVTTVAFTLTACFENSNNGTGTGNYFDRAQEALEEAGFAIIETTREQLEQTMGANNVPIGLIRQIVVFIEGGSVSVVEFDTAENAAIAAPTMPRGGEGSVMRINGSIVYVGRGQPVEIIRNIIGGTIVP